MLVAFRCRCTFIQYMAKNLPNIECKYAENCVPYVCSNRPFNVVNRLVEPIKKSNRNLTPDNCFSSSQLALIRNKTEVPALFVNENTVHHQHS